MYGVVAPSRKSTKTDEEKVQHTGYGRRLMREAERIAVNRGYDKIAVIAGIGVRNYYRKLGYELRGLYMVKDLKKDEYKGLECPVVPFSENGVGRKTVPKIQTRDNRTAILIGSAVVVLSALFLWRKSR